MSIGDHTPDEALLDALVASGSHAAFSLLVRRHSERFRRLAYRFTGSREEAEDIVQAAFLKLWDKPHSWNGANGARFTTWFYRIVVNSCLDQQRRHKPVPIQEGEEFADEAPSADQLVQMNEEQACVERALRALPRPMQTALNLSFFEPVANKDAAAVMGMSLKAFQSLLIRAKKALKEALNDEPNRTRYES